MSQAIDKNGNIIPIGGQSLVSNLDGLLGSAQSEIFDKISPTDVRLKAIGDTYFLIGENPTATTSNATLLSDGETECWRIPANNKIACISGILNITVYSHIL